MHKSIQIIDKFLSFLADNEWHQLNEIQEKLGIPQEKLTLIVNFLEKYDFVTCREGKVKINQQLKSLIKEELE